MFVRIYNKAAEQLVEGPWVRVELQARKERARQLADTLIKNGMSCVAGVLRNYIDIKEPSLTDSNRRRWASVPYWFTFCDAAEKLCLGVAPALKTLAEKAEHFARQYSVTAAMLSVVPSYGRRFLRQVLRDGLARMKGKHVDLVDAALKSDAHVLSMTDGDIGSLVWTT